MRWIKRKLAAKIAHDRRVNEYVALGMSRAEAEKFLRELASSGGENG